MTKQLYQKDVTAVTVSINAHTCWKCGVVYGISDDHERRLRDYGETHYCTNGHGAVFGNRLKEAQEELARVEAARGQILLANKRLADDLMDAAKEARLLKRRAKYGVCSECHRSFRNVKRHMSTKHGGSEK